jgi:hypothetical protein
MINFLPLKLPPRSGNFATLLSSSSGGARERMLHNPHYAEVQGSYVLYFIGCRLMSPQPHCIVHRLKQDPRKSCPMGGVLPNCQRLLPPLLMKSSRPRTRCLPIVCGQFVKQYTHSVRSCSKSPHNRLGLPIAWILSKRRSIKKLVHTGESHTIFASPTLSTYMSLMFQKARGIRLEALKCDQLYHDR